MVSILDRLMQTILRKKIFDPDPIVVDPLLTNAELKCRRKVGKETLLPWYKCTYLMIVQHHLNPLIIKQILKICMAMDIFLNKYNQYVVNICIFIVQLMKYTPEK